MREAPESPKMEDIIEELKKQGYEIKGPPSWEEIQRLQRQWQEEIERAKEEERKKVDMQIEKEIQKERINATKEIVNNVIKHIVSLFAPAGSAVKSSGNAQAGNSVNNVDRIRQVAKKAKELRREVSKG